MSAMGKLVENIYFRPVFIITIFFYVNTNFNYLSYNMYEMSHHTVRLTFLTFPLIVISLRWTDGKGRDFPLDSSDFEKDLIRLKF